MAEQRLTGRSGHFLWRRPSELDAAVRTCLNLGHTGFSSPPQRPARTRVAHPRQHGCRFPLSLCPSGRRLIPPSCPGGSVALRPRVPGHRLACVTCSRLGSYSVCLVRVSLPKLFPGWGYHSVFSVMMIFHSVIHLFVCTGACVCVSTWLLRPKFN